MKFFYSSMFAFFVLSSFSANGAESTERVRPHKGIGSSGFVSGVKAPLKTLAARFRNKKSSLSGGETLVSLDGATPITLTKSTSCRKFESPMTSCKCCIVKHAMRSDGILSSSNYKKGAVSACSKHCDEGVLDDIISELKLAEGANHEELTKALIERVANLEYFGKKDAFFGPIARLVSNGKLPMLPKTLTDDSFSIRPLGGGGAQTLELYGVFTDKGMVYLVKGLKKTLTEAKNNLAVESSLKNYSLKNRGEKQRIAIAFPLAHFKTADKKMYAVLPAAPGEQLVVAMKNYVKENSDLSEGPVLDRMEKTMGDTGKLFAEFHASGIENVDGSLGYTGEAWTGRSRHIHGDAHANNIFVMLDKSGAVNLMTFIDAETMKGYLKHPGHASIDLGRLMIFMTYNKAAHQYVRGEISSKTWYAKVLRPLFAGYAEYFAKKAWEDKNSVQGYVDAMKVVKESFTFLSTKGGKQGFANALVRTVKGGSLTKILMDRRYFRAMLENIEAQISEELGKNFEEALKSYKAEIKAKKGKRKKEKVTAQAEEIIDQMNDQELSLKKPMHAPSGDAILARALAEDAAARAQQVLKKRKPAHKRRVFKTELTKGNQEE